MTIKECKEQTTLPKVGTLCKIVEKIKSNEEVKGYLVHDKYIKTRKANSLGKVTGYFPGTGGDVWAIEYDNGEIAAHDFDEVIDQ